MFQHISLGRKYRKTILSKLLILAQSRRFLKKRDVYHAGSQDSTTRSFDEINSLFESIEKVLFVELSGSITDFIDVDLYDALLVKTCEDTIPGNFCEDGYGVIEIDDVEYELVSLICVSDIDERHNRNWVGNVYARHGGTFKS